MSETVNLVAGRTWVTGESVTATKMNTAMTGSTVTIVGVNPTGTNLSYFGTTEPTGYIFANGLTIGNASSNATSRANADTSALFTLLWDASLASDNLVVLESGGGTATRGASASIDYANNYQIPVPNMGGRIPLGVEQSGGASNTGSISARTSENVLYEKMGNQSGQVTLNLDHDDIPHHTHLFGGEHQLAGGTANYTKDGDITTGGSGNTHSYGDASSATGNSDNFDTQRGGSQQTAASTENAQSTHNLDNNSGNSGDDQGVMQPSLLTSYIIKL